MTTDTPLTTSGLQPISPSTCLKQERLAVLLLIALTGGLLLARLGSAEPLGSANDRSRWCTVASLADQQSYIIDDMIRIPGWDTIDKVRHEGHFYSTKPPLYPTLLAGLYWTIRQLTGLNLYSHTNLVAQIILLLVNILPFLLALYFWWRLLIRAGFRPETRLLLIGLTGLTTTLTPYFTVLNNHTTGATSLMFALAAAGAIVLPTPRNGSQQARTEIPGWLFAACGFFAAFTCCNELPAALFGLGIFGLLAWHDWKKTATWFAPAALVPLIAFFVTTYLATGGWKPFYMYYGTEKYVYEHLGVPSYWSEPRGLDKARDSVPVYIFHCLVGHHGIFSLTPLFLLVFPGYWSGLKHRQGAMRFLHGMGLLLTLAILAFYWKRTENYNYGGVSVALRWVVWLIPFWLLAMAEFLDLRTKSLKWTCVVILLGVPSLYSAWSPWHTPWQQPWLYNLMANAGWIDYSDPPPRLEKKVTTWLMTVPDTPEIDPDFWIELRNGEFETLRLSDGGSAPGHNQPTRILIAEYRNAAGTLQRTRTLTLSLPKFESEVDPGYFLLDWKDTDPQGTLLDQLNFLRGVRGPVYYRAAHDRYVFTPVRENAFRCQRIVGRVLKEKTETTPAIESRADIFRSAEVPFGLVQWRQTVTDLTQHQLLSSETWQLIATGRRFAE